MSQTENGLRDVGDVFHVMTTWTPQAIVRCRHLGRKVECFLDGKRGEMYVVLGGVDNIAAVVLGNVFWCERVIMHFTFHKMILGALVGERFQEGAASRAWAAQYD